VDGLHRELRGVRRRGAARHPVALGYESVGYNVAWGGNPDPAHDAGGVCASGLNNIYPYYVK
jgi:hypothetical protein